MIQLARRKGYFATPCALVYGLAIGWAALGLPSARSLASEPGPQAASRDDAQQASNAKLFDRSNLIAWCIVPFDSKHRSPEDRAAMLQRLGFKHFAYDWRAEHIPSFDAEVEALAKHGVSLDAFWTAPGELNNESRIILDLLKRHGIKAQLWVLLDFGSDQVTGDEQKKRVEAAAAKLGPLAREADKIGCKLALYNHGGWFGEPENQIEIIKRLNAEGITNLGIVYNLHHGHDHLDRFPALLQTLKPYLLCLNLNGMDLGGDKVGRKILPLGQGDRDLTLLTAIRESGYSGPIGILGHTDDDAEERLKDNLDGLDWLVPQLDGKPAGPPPTPRTPVPPRPVTPASLTPEEHEQVQSLVAEARTNGDVNRGAEIFMSANYSCSNCHKAGEQGGTIGPELSTVGVCLSPAELAEAVLWPSKRIKPGYEAIAVSTDDGRILQGYPIEQNQTEILFKDAASGAEVKLTRASIEEMKPVGTVMPEGVAASMTPAQRRDLLRFLMELGRSSGSASKAIALHTTQPAAFTFNKEPLHPERWPNASAYVNRERIYDFYTKEAEYFRAKSPMPMLLPQFPGLDGGVEGHWGNQNEKVWVDGRWNETDLGTLMSGVFRGDGKTIPKAICVRLGDRGEISACFNPETLSYEAVWKGGFVKFSPTRHGFVDGLIMDGTPIPTPAPTKPNGKLTYKGLYRNGNRVVFAYQIGDKHYLDSPWVKDGEFVRTVTEANDPTLSPLIQGGPAQWPQVFKTQGKLGAERPYTIDTIEPPFDNPWKAPLFFGDHDFLADGSAMICTMGGDVWHVEGLDATLENVRWRRFASGLHHALGLVVHDGLVHVLGRDQITRLHDLNGDGEADFYECLTNAYTTSPAGHDFICGLQRDAAGNFYTVSGNQGLLKLNPADQSVQVLATGFRNPDGLGLTRAGEITVPQSEGEWVPASSINQIRLGGHYGYGGLKDGAPPDLPLVYLPRALDNSSGAQVEVTSDRWGPLQGQLIHFSFGAGTHFLVLHETVDGHPQGAVVPLTGDFNSGSHRGRFNPVDGQLYVSGMAGWGSYTSLDGCFQRVRYTGDPVHLPVAFHAHENGVRVSFAQPVDPSMLARPENLFAQAWNYRFSSSYGSQEYSPRHPGVIGHDYWTIRSAHLLDDGKSIFLEIPEIQPVNQLHLHLIVDQGEPQDLFATIHKLASPFTGFPSYRPEPKTIAAHPILADLAAMNAKKIPSPWKAPIPNAREVVLAAGQNLTFTVSSFTVKAGEPIKLVFTNPDVVPHNWALIRPGTLAKVGDLVNKVIAEPDAALRHYIPKTDDILVYAEIVEPTGEIEIYFKAPEAKGRYPYLCTFPGHWMVMNGVMTVE